MTTKSFELVPAGETYWSRGLDPDNLILILAERDAAGEEVGGTRIATFSNMRFMDSLGPRLAKLCQETAQAELDKAGGVPPRAPTKGPEPFAQIGDDVFVTDYDWRNPKLARPGSWLFHDAARDRLLFMVRKRDVGDDPSIELLAALYLTFQAGERAGREEGRDEGRAELAGEMRKLMGVPA
ncbi:hypothetical protein NS228_04990 [Methylobacterium indicum]|uniref:hypothetical protein n=1 Tax=Methylobacterium indicum TaxID=1775910 RepID=UPI000734E081|nr:hypothetical protein [Methylobacterium indicum]KTS39510.1 hypothetical protein NS229_00075 [Methylobacterium indicum]KTS41742.1 hypothetical protein NS228_04990 [Methylobacterium indicum]KTS53520.1 hypothetical protein NS230_05465 [Methylobacterium indicum]